MVMKAFSKTVFRMFRVNIGRLIATTAIIILGIAIISGLGAVSPNLQNATNNYFKDSATQNITVKSTSPAGFSSGQIDAVSEIESVGKVMPVSTMDILSGESVVRLYYMPLSDLPLNKLTLAKGSLPETPNEIVIEQRNPHLDRYEIGDEIEIDLQMGFGPQTFLITGFVESPLIFSKETEPSNYDGKDLSAVIYFDNSLSFFSVITDLYIEVSGAYEYDIFSTAYENAVNACIEDIKTVLGSYDFVFLTHNENFSFALIKMNTEKLEVISFIVPVFFVAVAALVALTTMTRLVESERSLIGCYRTLGYGSGRILMKYIIFALVCCVAGSLLGLLVGNTVIMPIIFNGYGALFSIPSLTSGLYLNLGAVIVAIMTAAIMSITIYVAAKSLREKPASLLKYKAPKEGGKILLEKIPFVWNRLKFKYKSSLRNIFRYARYFIMTVISVAGSSALVFIGFALYDVTSSDKYGLGLASDSLAAISAVVIICAALLSILVIFNLTNINIEERKREIAALKVLGYKDNEVSGYIFREIIIMAAVGILLGLPLGYMVLNVVFIYLEFGSVTDISWFIWIITVVLSIAFILIVDLMLFRKIIKTDMNASLKIND